MLCEIACLASGNLLFFLLRGFVGEGGGIAFVIIYVIMYALSIGVNYLLSKYGYYIPLVGLIIAPLAKLIFLYLKTIGVIFLILCILCTLGIIYF